jgi:hypothetical protein
MVCVVTAVSISLLSLVTADLDTCFHGFIKIRLQPLEALIRLIDEAMLRDCVRNLLTCYYYTISSAALLLLVLVVIRY